MNPCRQSSIRQQPWRLPKLEQPAGERREEGHHGAEQEGGEPGQPPRHAAEYREADVDPGDAAKEEAKAESTAGERRFGWPSNNFIGSGHQANSWQSSWGAFWRDQRLGVQLQQAEAAGRALPQAQTLLELVPEWLSQHQPDLDVFAAFQQVCDRVETGLGAAEGIQ